MTNTNDLSSLVPGFDFLQGLFRNASSSLPGLGQWVTPTLDPAEVDKRIQELKTVQFWLEQNARILATTVQALEVQRMTLGALQAMNVPLADLGDALTLRQPPPASSSPAPAPAPLAQPATPTPQPAPTRAATPDEPSAPAHGVDPMQWWGTLTQQFAQIASRAVQDVQSQLPGATPPPGAAATPGRADGTSVPRPAPSPAATPAPAKPAATPAAPRTRRATGHATAGRDAGTVPPQSPKKAREAREAPAAAPTGPALGAPKGAARKRPR